MISYPRVGAANGLAFLHFVSGEVFGRNQASTLADIRSQFASYCAVVEIVGIFGDAFESAGEFRLLEDVARLIVVSVAQKDAFRFGKLCQVPNCLEGLACLRRREESPRALV